jgi:hypothetical protein
LNEIIQFVHMRQLELFPRLDDKRTPFLTQAEQLPVVRPRRCREVRSRSINARLVRLQRVNPARSSVPAVQKFTPGVARTSSRTSDTTV